MTEEEKAIKWLEKNTKNYSLSGEELHYSLILYYLIINLQRENQKLKKQLDDYKNRYKSYLNNKLSEDVEPDVEDFYLAELEEKANAYDELIEKKQTIEKTTANECKQLQKEFIKYLEEPIRIITEGNPTNISEYTSAKLDTLKEILSKYKEIIGGKGGKN